MKMLRPIIGKKKKKEIGNLHYIHVVSLSPSFDKLVSLLALSIPSLALNKR